jgi:hypothetical protein
MVIICIANVSKKRADSREKLFIAAGTDPQAESRACQAVPTWDTFITDSYLPHATQVKRTWKNDADMHRLRLSPRFGSTPINAITRQSIQQFHNELKEAGMAPATADHHLKFLRHALNMAVDWGMLASNPAAKIASHSGAADRRRAAS